LNEWFLGDTVGRQASGQALLPLLSGCPHWRPRSSLYPNFANLHEMKRGGSVKKILTFVFIAGVFLILSTKEVMVA